MAKTPGRSPLYAKVTKLEKELRALEAQVEKKRSAVLLADAQLLRELHEQLGRWPSLAEISARTGIGRSRCAQLLKFARGASDELIEAVQRGAVLTQLADMITRRPAPIQRRALAILAKTPGESLEDQKKRLKERLPDHFTEKAKGVRKVAALAG